MYHKGGHVINNARVYSTAELHARKTMTILFRAGFAARARTHTAPNMCSERVHQRGSFTMSELTLQHHEVRLSAPGVFGAHCICPTETELITKERHT